MTLFASVASEDQIFKDALEKYFAGEFDQITVERLTSLARVHRPALRFDGSPFISRRNFHSPVECPAVRGRVIATGRLAPEPSGTSRAQSIP